MTAGLPLLERDAPAAALRDAIRRACQEQGSMPLIVGPAGIGKSALLNAVRPLALEHGALVLSARASDLDRGFGFGVVHQLLEPVVHASDDERRARLFAGAASRAQALFGGAGAGGHAEYAVLSGLSWLVANLADEQPVVLRIDDLHWADVPSLRMLEFLGRRIEDLPVVVVGTLRPDEAGAPADLLAALADAPAAHTIELAPLSGRAAGTMLARALGADPADGFRDAALGATGGNPLLLSVLAREAAVHGLRGAAHEQDRLPELGARGVAPIVARRLGGLGAPAETVARAAAVAGERARLDDLTALAGLAPDEVRATLGVLAHAQLLEPGTWAFAHPLVRDAVVAATPHLELERLHRLAARRLRERGARPAEVALHWLATEPAGDAGAVADLRAAARDASAEGATTTAVDLLRRACEEGAVIADGASLLLELAEHELRALLPEGTARMREALAAGLDGEEAVRARAALGTVLLLTDPAAAFAEIDSARAHATDRGLRLRLEASALEALVFADALADERRARYAGIRSTAAPSVVAHAHLASEASLAGEPADRVSELARLAVSGGVLAREVGPGASTWNLLVHALRRIEEPERARRLLVAGGRVVRERGLRAAGAFVDQAWGYWHRDFGSAVRGLAHAEAGYEGVVEAGLPMSRGALAAVVAENLILLDRAEEADAIMEGALDGIEGTFVEVFALAARGLARARVGRRVEAEDDLRRAVAIQEDRGWHAPAATRGRIRLGDLLVDAGRAGEAGELVDRDIVAARTAGTSGALGMALRVRARTLEGRERIDTLRQAADELGASPLRLEAGRALLALGTALRHHGDLAGARAVLREALDRASRTESAWLARLVRAELEASGARPRRERVTGVDALTPSERRVAGLAAEGLTNREIAEALWVTRKTVEYHLGNVYGKLGIRSRGALGPALDGPENATETLG